MIIKVDQEGRRAVQQLCDIALKSAGMQNLNPINKILRSVMLLPTPEVEEQPRPKSSKEEDEAESQAAAEKQEEKEKEEVVEDKEVGKE